MSHKLLIVVAAVVCLLLLPLVGAQADTTISYSDSISSTSTNWQDSLTFPKFNLNPALHWLKSVKVILEAGVEGSAGVENTSDVSLNTITSYLTANVVIYRPGPGALIVDADPLISTVDTNLPIFDTVIDYGGTSGITHGGLTADDSDSSTLTGAGDLALFTGAGNIILPTWATGASYATDTAGNFASSFVTSAWANGTVEYTYGTIPEPATLALMSLGLVGIGAWRRRRQVA